MKPLQDYIKLAESATDGPWEVADEVLQTEGGFTVVVVQPDVDMTRGHDAWEENAQFIAASRTLGPAMAKALIEAEEALEYFNAGGLDSQIAEKALSQIQALNGGEDDKQR